MTRHTFDQHLNLFYGYIFLKVFTFQHMFSTQQHILLFDILIVKPVEFTKNMSPVFLSNLDCQTYILKKKLICWCFKRALLITNIYSLNYQLLKLETRKKDCTWVVCNQGRSQKMTQIIKAYADMDRQVMLGESSLFSRDASLDLWMLLIKHIT